jgi:hypothetical protein
MPASAGVVSSSFRFGEAAAVTDAVSERMHIGPGTLEHAHDRARRIEHPPSLEDDNMRTSGLAGASTRDQLNQAG